MVNYPLGIMGRTSDAKERLLAAALNLIWEASYGSVTIDDICRRADVRKGSFYYFFDGKAELAKAALEESWRMVWKPFLDDHFSSSAEPLDRIRAYLNALYLGQKAEREKHGRVLGCPVCSVGTGVCTTEAEIAEVVRELLARKRRYYESTIRDAMAAGVIEPCDPATRAVAFGALVEGLLAQARIMNDLAPLEALPGLGLDLLRAKTPAAAG